MLQSFTVTPLVAPGSPRFGNADDLALHKLLGSKYGPSLADEFRDDDALRTLLRKPRSAGPKTSLAKHKPEAKPVSPQRVAPRAGWRVSSLGEPETAQDKDDVLLELAMTPPPAAASKTPDRSKIQAAVIAKQLADSLATVKAEVVAGGAGAGGQLHQLRLPLGVCPARDGSLLVADTGNSRLVKWLPSASSGEVLVTKAQSRGSRFEPVHICIDGKGLLFASASGSVELWSDLGKTCHEVRSGKWPTGLVLERSTRANTSAARIIYCDSFDNSVTRCRISVASALVTFQQLGKSRSGSGELTSDSPWRLRRPFGLSISCDQTRLLIAEPSGSQLASQGTRQSTMARCTGSCRWSSRAWGALESTASP
mmetsp:Transcript_88265/g.193444  ORF Transcript_88265/g.193444 Transcript_88265/m.193444 type:complete len:368 (+) Transcript_88265:57-1160(+)